MSICDSHVHFFSPGFFAGLGANKEAITGLGWVYPESTETLANQWVAELDKHGVSRAAVIASLPGDADSVARAIALHPSRFVGFFMLDPTRDDAVAYATRALDDGLRTMCLFPAMHHFSLRDPRVERVFAFAADRPGTAVFVHCGELSVGVRKKLGLPSAFDMSLGVPTHLEEFALAYPSVPIIIPHFGAGMFPEALWLADRCASVYLDTSSSNSWITQTPKNLSLAGVFTQVLGAIGPDRLLFGTDSSFFPRGWNRDVYETQRAALDTIGAGSDVQDKIFGGNFARLFPDAPHD
jgi:hypothetical protein